MIQIMPFKTLLTREIKRWKKIAGQAVFSPMVTSSLYLIIFGVGLGSHLQSISGISYAVFLIPGLITMVVINNSYMNPAFSIIISKFYGDIEDLKTTPIKPIDIVFSMATAAFLRGLLVAVIVFFVSEVFLFFHMGELLMPKHPLLLFFLLLLAGFTFGFLGICAGMIAKSYETLNSINQFIILPLTYLGGVFFSLEHLHPFWQKCALVNPIFYYVNLVRYAFLGFSDIPKLYGFIIMTLFFVTLYIAAYFFTKNASYKHL